MLFILQVFLRHAPLNRGIAQSGVIYGARGFLYGGLLWSALAVSLQGLSAAAFGVTPTIWFIELQETWWTELLFGIQLAGFLVVYLVQVAVVVNYATQCELLIAYIKGIAVRLREKSTDLRVAMHVSSGQLLAARSFVWLLLPTEMQRVFSRNYLFRTKNDITAVEIAMALLITGTFR